MPQQIVLVTGATGLLGREVVDAFRRDSSWKVVGQGFTRAAPPDVLKADLQDEVEAVRLLDEVKYALSIYLFHLALLFEEGCSVC